MPQEDFFILPVYQENEKMKKEIHDMLLYIKDLQRQCIDNKDMFEAMTKFIYKPMHTKATQTDGTKTLQKQQLRLQRNWSK
jgi:hypothetical protein